MQDVVCNNLQNFATELARQAQGKRDFIVPTSRVDQCRFGIGPDNRLGLMLKTNGGNEFFPSNDHCHSQLADKLKIPKRYYDRMLEERPGLLVKNINEWFEHEPKKRMIRTLDGEARAFLSDRYRPIDNYDLMQAILPVLQGLRVDFKQSAFTQTRLHMKAIFPEMQAEIIPADGRHTQMNRIVNAGLIITNSEVGCSSVSIELMVWRQVCSNALVVGQSLRKYHVGGRRGNGEENLEQLYTDRTKAADDRAFMLKVQDVVRGAASADVFQDNVDKIQSAAQRQIGGSVHQVVERVAEMQKASDTEKDGILKHLINGGDLSAWGVTNAITRMAQDVDSYDRRVELERSAKQIIELSPNDWQNLNN